MTKFKDYATDVMNLRYSHTVWGRKESWFAITQRVCLNVLNTASYYLPNKSLPKDVQSAIISVIKERKFIPGGRILSQAGREYHQTDNCFCLQAEDTREGWAELAKKTTMMFMSGGGVGCDYSSLRPYGSSLARSGGISSGPLPLIKMIDCIAAAARQGGERRGANYASLAWDHPDVKEFIEMKTDGQSLKHTNISVRFNPDFQDCLGAYCHDGKYSANEIFYSTLKHACQYGDPGFQFDWDNQILRNACTEIISKDNEDSCCLGSVNLAKIHSLHELQEVTELGVLFLLCNTLYTDCPTSNVRKVKEKNRRIGLGLMGVAEWFIQRNQYYGENQCIFDSDCMSLWLENYRDSSNLAAIKWADTLSIAQPVAVRAIAPTGTISTAIGHTTPGIEPVFCQAYQRTYNTLKSQEYQDGFVKEVVIDPVIQKLVEEGHSVRDIDTAWSLSQNVEGIERRLAFQAFVQGFVDNAISSTVNLPQYEEGVEDTIAPVLLKYLPLLRGVTFYPDGRYDNQPVRPVDINKVLSTTRLQEHESCKLDNCGN